MRRNAKKRYAYRVEIRDGRGDLLSSLQAAEDPLQALTLVAHRWISSPSWKRNPPAPWFCSQAGPDVWKYSSCAFDAQVRPMRFV